jgi:SAM-dependent methyltransferase
MPAAPGRTGWGGNSAMGRELVEALVVASTDDVTADSLTHPVHPYAARLHPATARALVDLTLRGAPRDALVFYPFCGSGTVVVEARASGWRAAGIDLNPLAVRLARAKTWTAPVPVRRRAREIGLQIAADVLTSGRDARRAGFAPAPMRAPVGFDPNARQKRIGKWFSPHVRRELEAIAAAIDEVGATEGDIANVLSMALSAVLYKVSHRRSDTDPTWIERAIGRGMAARLFGERVAMIVAGLEDLAQTRAPIPEVFEADARALPTLGLPPAAAIITSPPYAGTYDYAEQHRLRFDFLGLRHRAFDDGELGSRRSFTASESAAGTQWRGALAEVMAAIAQGLAPGGLAAVVMGDSIGGAHPRHADDDLRAALDDRLVPVAWAWQERTMLGNAERRAFVERPKREHVFVLERR